MTTNSRKLDPDEFLEFVISNFGEENILKAVHELSHEEIVFEGQFPFLSAPSMKERNFDAQMFLFERYGYMDRKITHVGMFQLPDQSWRSCFYRYDERFTTHKDVEDAVIIHFNSSIEPD